MTGFLPCLKNAESSFPAKGKLCHTLKQNKQTPNKTKLYLLYLRNAGALGAQSYRFGILQP